MNIIIQEIQKSNKKPKQLINDLVKKVQKDEKLFKSVIDCLENGSDVEKGISGEVMKYITEENSKIVQPYIDTIIKYLNDDLPKVKWQTSRVIGNIAKDFPGKVDKAVPKLLLNTEDKGTVARWCAAYALSEIIKSSDSARKTYLAKIQEIVKKEKNNGVKNVYEKALKDINK